MKTTRLLVVPALAAASLLALTGCIQLPPVGGGTTETQAPATGGDSGTETGDLAGSTWTGTMGDDFATFTLVLAEDGTVDFPTWNDQAANFDSAGDVWEGDASNLSLTVTELQNQSGDQAPFDVTFTGTAQGGQMQLQGDAPDGTWELTATQD